jgi:hypothetical protein
MSGTQQPKYTPAQNIADRMNLLQTGVRMTTRLGTFGPYSAGQIANIRLQNVGIITGLRLRVTATQAASVALTASPLAPYSAVSKIEVVDYNTTTRQSAPGFMFYMLNSTRQGRPFMPVGQGSVDTQQTAAPTTTGGGTLYANFEVPICVDPMNDLSGAIVAQTVVGEQFLNVTFASAAVGDVTAPYTAGTGSLTNFYVTVWQDYIQPAGRNLPLIDLNTVYEFLGNYSTNLNIVTGGQSFIDYPNVRSVRGFYAAFVDNAALAVNGTDISAVTLVANGNTNMRQYDPLLIRRDMRNMLGGDLPASLYFLNHRKNPIQTWIYSQVQAQFNWATVTSSPAPYLMYGFESLYLQNTPLPGIAASA